MPFAHHSVRTLIALSTLAIACSSAQAQSYKLQLPLEDDEDVILQDIVTDAKKTQVTLLLKNTTSTTSEFCAQPNGSPEAFTLKDLDSGKVLQQQSITGGSFCNVKMEKLEPGRTKFLKITFPPLPATAKRLQLGEGSCKPETQSGLIYWCFDNIVLPAR